MTEDLDDLLTGLDALENEATAVDPKPPAAAGAPVLPPRPPARPAARRTAHGSASTRTDFGDLFASEPAPRADPGAGPEAKMDLLRDRLRLAENKLARVRNAWEIRDAELDGLETDLATARKRAQELERNLETLATELAGARGREVGLQQKVEALEGFIREKKAEFDNYAAKVQGAFGEQNRVVNEMRQRLEELEKRSAQAQPQGESIGKLGASMDSLEKAERQRRLMIENLQRELELKDSESERLMMALRAERAQRAVVERESKDTGEPDASRLQMALRAETAKVTALQEKVDALDNLVARLRRALRAERSKAEGEGQA